MTRPFSDSPTGELSEILVHDVPEPCPYIKGKTARMPLRLQFQRDGKRLDTLLSLGDRRVGPLMYRTECPQCNACIPLRIPIDDFKMTRSHKRVWKKNQDLQLHITSPPPVARERVALFNMHRAVRGLSEKKLGLQGYNAWLSQTWTSSHEFAWYLGEDLICVSIVDVGEESTSAVYCYFDPEHSKRSLGTFAILKTLEWARIQGFSHHYLGLYVAENAHLSYKSSFLPHERLEGEEWTRHDEK